MRSQLGRGKTAGGEQHRARGAALVEFAIVLPLLLMLAFGILTGGTAYEQKLAITHAAREGARYGASVAQDQVFTSGTWATTVQQVVVDRASGDLDLSASGQSVCVSLVEGSSGAGNGVLVVSPSSNPPTANVQSSYTTRSDGSSPCDSAETYPTTATDQGRRVQVRVSRPGKLEAVAFTVTMTLTSKATSRYEVMNS
jgi:Flp pilus assembly protein TadG